MPPLYHQPDYTPSRVSSGVTGEFHGRQGNRVEPQLRVTVLLERSEWDNWVGWRQSTTEHCRPGQISASVHRKRDF